MKTIATQTRTRARQVWSVLRLTPFDTSTEGGRTLERYRRIALTTVTGLGARIIGMVTSLATIPLALNYLGKEQFGIWSTITSLLVWAGLFNFGIANGLVNAISEAHGRDDRDAAAGAVATALAILTTIAVVLGAALLIAAPLVPWHTILNTGDVISARQTRWAVVGAGAAFLLSMPLTILPQIYNGYQRAYIANFFNVLGALAVLAGIALCVRFAASLPVLIFVFGAAWVLVNGVNLLLLFAVQMPWLRPRIRNVSGAALRRLSRTSIPMFLYQIGALLVSQSQLLVLAHVAGYELVGEYNILFRVYVLVIGLIQMGTYSFVPPFREALERGDRDWIRKSFRRLLGLRLTMAVGAGVGWVLIGNPVLRLWLGEAAVQFTPMTWAAMAVLLVASTWVTAFTDLMTILDRIWPQVWLVIINGIITIGLTIVLTPGYGVLGVVLALAAVTTLAWTWIVPLMSRSLLGAPVPARVGEHVPGEPSGPDALESRPPTPPMP